MFSPGFTGSKTVVEAKRTSTDSHTANKNKKLMSYTTFNDLIMREIKGINYINYLSSYVDTTCF